MAEGELLGVAVLELKTDDRQLNAGMARTRLKVEQEAARMQTSVDRRMAAISAAMSTVSHSADQMAASFERAAIAQDAVAGASDKATEAFARETVAIRALTAATDDLAASRAAAASAGAGVNAKHVFYHSDPARAVALGGGSAAGGGGGGLRNALYGRGRFGAAAPLTLGAFAGLGVEHILTTALAIAGSAAAGAAGGGLLALGAGGQMAVGGGSDVAAMKTALTNVSATSKAMDKLDTAVTAYGANSTQAQAAQKALNGQMKVLADSVGPKTAKAEANVAKQANALGDAWQHASSQAQFQGTKIMGQALHLGRTYVPLVAHAAAQNLAIINKDLKPLFTWLEGPHGIGIFNNLEKNFKQNLPSAIHALDQGVEFFLRVMNIASNYTGGFTKTLDRLFTRLNATPNWKINDVVHRLVDDFRLWEHFAVLLGKDIYELFKNDAGTGNSIIKTLTVMLQKLHDWETSAQGQQRIRTIFEVHKQEVLALLHALVALAKPFSQIYLTLAPPLVRAVTGLAAGFAAMVNALNGLGPGVRDLIGITLLAGKFGLLSKAVRAVGINLGFVAKESKAASESMGAANVVSVGSAGRSEAGLSAGMTNVLGKMGVKDAAGTAAKVGKTVTGMMKGVGMAAGGVLAGTIVQSFIPGLKQNLGQSLIGGAGGGLIGSIFGPVGTVAGSALGSALMPEVVSLLHPFFESQGEKDGKAMAASFSKRFGPDVLARIKPQFDRALHDYQQSYIRLVNQVRPPGQPPAQNRYGSVYQTPNQRADQPKPLTQTEANQLAERSRAVLERAFQGHPVAPQAFESTMSALTQHLPPAMKVVAIKGMLAFADTLRSKGRLSEKGLSEIVAYAQKIAPTLATTLGFWGKTSADRLAKAWKFTEARDNLRSLLQDVNHTWVTGRNDAKASQEKMIRDAGHNMKLLHDTMVNSTGKTRRQALADWQKLHDGVLSYLKSMAHGTQDQMRNIVAEVEQHNGAAEKSFNQKWSNMSNAVYSAMASGALSTKDGAEILQRNTNAILKMFGAKGIPLASIIATLPRNVHDTVGQSGIGHRARGGRIDRPTVMVGEEAPQHPEFVIASNPKYRKDNLKYWAHAGKMLGIPGFAAGGYVYPFPPGTSVGRTDMGVDADMPVGAPIGAIGPARILNIQPNWFAGQPAIWEQLTGGPMAGRIVYLAEQINPLVHAGQHVSAHQAIARYASHGTGIEMGWGAPGDRTLAQATSGYHEGQVTAAGAAFRAFIAGLSHGKLVGGMGGGFGTIPTVQAPHVRGSGTVTREIQLAMNRGAKAANAYLQKHLASLVTGAGNFSIASGLHGSVPRRVQQALRGIANKVGLAGVLGNAMQESGLNPASIGSGGGGLWGFTPLGPEQAFAAAHHRPWTDVGAQVAFMLSQGGGSAIAAANRAGSPAAAALAFMNLYERPGIPAAANREHYAQEAFAQGYAKGGVVNKDPWLAHWGKNYWSLWHHIHKLYPGMTRRQVGPYMHWLDTHHKGDERSRLLNNLYAQTALNQQSAMINAAMSDVFHPDALGHPLAFDRYVGAGRRHPRHMHHFRGMQLPAFGGVFHTGGIVPGAPGTERTIVAEAGERIGHDGEVCVYVVVKDGAVDARKIEATAQRVVDGAARRTATRVHRHLPSRGGGSLALQR